MKKQILLACVCANLLSVSAPTFGVLGNSFGRLLKGCQTEAKYDSVQMKGVYSAKYGSEATVVHFKG